MSSNRRVAIVGAGVVGLSTAFAIQRNLSDVKVTVIADKFLHETLSIGAGGYFRPEANISPDDTLDIVKKWSKDSYDHFVKIATSSEAGQAGVQLVNGYHLSAHSEVACNNIILNELTPDMRKVSGRELNQLFPERFVYGVNYTTVIADQRYYLKYLTTKIKENGGQFLKREVKSLVDDELLDGYDVIVNCSGLAAKYLANDHKITPIRGQTINVRAPWIKMFVFADGAYIIPASDGRVTLGGVKDFGSSSTELTERDYKSIKDRCTELIPSLANAEVIEEWVGLRPFRQPVRVEPDKLSSRKVIHNYGHGAHGVSLSWGTALHATDLVNQALNENSKLKSNL